ncbi:YraN family protein [Frateuria aurantia]
MSRQLGQAAEQRACAELQRQGLRLLQRNFSSRYGELDLIMQDGAELVFVEVRLRRDNRHGGASASVSAAKQQRLIRTAAVWLQQHPQYATVPCRFDVVGYSGIETGPEMEWIRAAFEAD